jgi:glutathione-regulated potassium-efflux system ancillary protein KefG
MAYVLVRDGAGPHFQGNSPRNSRRPNRMPSRVLILFAHPAYEKSRVHRQLAAAVRSLPGVTFHDLYEAYPDQDVDIAREQALLAANDVIVFQHPFYWYSVPPLLKQWMDLVLEHGWAYGSAGRALEGKVLQVAMTAGGREMAYGPEGFNRFTFREFLIPVEATARLCRMEFREPWVRAGTHEMTSTQTQQAAADYAALITQFTGGV